MVLTHQEPQAVMVDLVVVALVVAGVVELRAQAALEFFTFSIKRIKQ